MTIRRRTQLIAAVLAALTLCGVALHAQQRFGGGRNRLVVLREGAPVQRGPFTFCRLMYDSVRREAGGQGWWTDYPAADANFMYRLEEMTNTRVSRAENGDYAFTVVRATDDGIYECPFLFASDVGTVGFSNDEVVRLRDFLLKGGFLWVDDFWGEYAWQQWVLEIQRVLPSHQIQQLPMNHPLFTTAYNVPRIPQVPSIQFWSSNYGATSERGAESAVPTMHAIFDDDGRLLVLMSHNTDIADGWEREGESQEFFHKFSPESYAVGLNVALWVLTH